MTAPTRQQHGLLSASIVGIVAVFLPVSGVTLAISTIGSATGATTSALQWVTAIYSLGMTLSIFSGGALIQLFGPRTVYIGGSALALVGAVGSVAVATLPAAAQVGTLIATQGIAGVGAGLLMPTSLALTTWGVQDRKRQSRNMSMWSFGLALALAAGPLLSATLLSLGAEWNLVFLPVAAASLFALLFGIIGIRLERPSAAAGRSLDLPGQATMALGSAGLIFTIIHAGASGLDLATVIAAVVTVASFMGFVVVERRSAQPAMNVRLLLHPGFAAANIAAACSMLGMVGVQFIISLWLGPVLDAPLRLAGLLLFVNLTNIIVSLFTRHLYAVAHPLVVAVCGLVLMAVSAFLLAATNADSAILDIGWRLIFLGAGASLTFSAVPLAVIRAVPEQERHIASATNTLFRQLGAGLGPACLGFVYTVTRSATSMTFAITGAFLAVAAVAIIVPAFRTSRQD